MHESQVRRAIAAATSIATGLGLQVDEAVVLHNSNKLALRLAPCGVVARIFPPVPDGGRFEIDLARRLADAGCPIGVPDPRVPTEVYERDGFMITYWTYYPTVDPDEPPADAYAAAIAQLHAGMRTVNFDTPHFTDRIESAQQLVTDRDQTPELGDDDREMLEETLRTMRKTVTASDSPDQLLHGEPHPGNLLRTADGPVFIDLETCCRGPVEFDLAHAPEGVGELYPGVDLELLRQCRVLMLAIITMWRWDRHDEFPDGRRVGIEWTARVREARAALDRG